MFTRIINFNLLITTLLMIYSSSANATLDVYITGTPGSGQTTWVFQGSSIAGNNGFFEDEADLGSADTWTNIGDYTTLNDQEITTVVAGATLTIAGVTRNIDEAYIDDDGAGANDDFGVGVDGATDFSFLAGDVVSWTGSLVVTGIDLNDVDETALPASFFLNNYGGALGTLELRLFIGTAAPAIASASVPTLSEWALLLLILSLGFISFRMHKRIS